jgi:hypothetical protein
MKGFPEKTPTDVWGRSTLIVLPTLDHPQEAKTTERGIGTHIPPKPDIELPTYKGVF